MWYAYQDVYKSCVTVIFVHLPSQDLTSLPLFHPPSRLRLLYAPPAPGATRVSVRPPGPWSPGGRPQDGQARPQGGPLMPAHRRGMLLSNFPPPLLESRCSDSVLALTGITYFFFFLLSFLFFQDFSRNFWIQTSTFFLLFKLCSLLFLGGGGGIPLLLLLFSSFFGLILSLLLRCLFGGKKIIQTQEWQNNKEQRKYRISTLTRDLLTTHEWAE